MERRDTVFYSLARHEKDILIDSLTLINQRRGLRLSITLHEVRHYGDYTRPQSLDHSGNLTVW